MCVCVYIIRRINIDLFSLKKEKRKNGKTLRRDLEFCMPYVYDHYIYAVVQYNMCGMFVFMLQHQCWHHNDGVPFNTTFSFLFPIPIPFHNIQFNSIQLKDVKDINAYTSNSHQPQLVPGESANATATKTFMID